MELDQVIATLARCPRGGRRSATTNPFFAGGARDSNPPALPLFPASLPQFLVELYSAIGFDEEIYVQSARLEQVTLVSPSEALERSTFPGFYDFAIAYAGMGHVRVWSASASGVHERMDGGANGYERLENERSAAESPRTHLSSPLEVLRGFLPDPIQQSERDNPRWCKAKLCRHRQTHVTMGHRCGTCHEYGHGMIECRKGTISSLRAFRSDTLPLHMRCTARSCGTPELHTLRGHICNVCGEHGHGEERHDPPADDQVRCPSCRMQQPRSAWKAAFITAECDICFEMRQLCISDLCRHPVCVDCLPHLLSEP